MRDADRQVLAQQAFVLTVKVLEDTLSDLTQVRGSALHGCHLVTRFCSVRFTHSLDTLRLKGCIYKHLLLIPFVYMLLHRKFSSSIVAL